MARLKEYGKIITGNTPPSSIPEYYTSNDICFVKPSDFSSDDVTIIEDSEYYISDAAQQCARMIPEGSILVTCIGTVGKVGIAKKEVAFNQQINAIIPVDDVDASCLAYSLLYYADRIKAIANAPVVPIINKSAFSDIDIPLPDLPTQRRIAATLDKVSEGIDLCRKMLRDLDELVKARFVEMFGTGHDGKCATAKIGNVCKFQQGTQIPVEMQIEEPRDGYRRFLRIIDYTQAPQPPRFVAVEGKAVDEKSVVIVRYGATAGFVGRGYRGILANNLFEVIPDENLVSKDFLYLALKHGTFERDIHEKAFGAAMPALSFAMMNDIPVVTPSHHEQAQFVTFVEQADKSKLAIQQQLTELETLKKSLMQEYFG